MTKIEDPHAIEQMRVKLLKLEHQRLELQMQNQGGRNSGRPANSTHLMDCLRSKIRQTKQRLQVLEAERTREGQTPWTDREPTARRA